MLATRFIMVRLPAAAVKLTDALGRREWGDFEEHEFTVIALVTRGLDGVLIRRGEDRLDRSRHPD
jgi:hypothetical protein